MTSRKRTYSSRADTEVKVIDTIIESTPIVSTTNTNESSFVLNLIQQGPGGWERVGRKALMLSARIRGVLEFETQPAAIVGDITANVVRMAVVWDKQPSGAGIPTFDEVFSLTLSDGTEGSTFLAPIRLGNMSRFTVLHDKTFDFKDLVWNGATGTAPVARYCLSFDEEVDLENRQTTFSGEQSPFTPTGISSGALYLILRARSNVANNTTVDTFTDDCFTRVHFVDA